jgi:hypothetical protein
MCPLVPWSLDRGKRRTPSLPQLKRRHRVPPWGLVLSSVALGNAIFLDYNTLAPTLYCNCNLACFDPVVDCNAIDL